MPANAQPRYTSSSRSRQQPSQQKEQQGQGYVPHGQARGELSPAPAAPTLPTLYRLIRILSFFNALSLHANFNATDIMPASLGQQNVNKLRSAAPQGAPQGMVWEAGRFARGRRGEGAQRACSQRKADGGTQQREGGRGATAKRELRSLCHNCALAARQQPSRGRGAKACA